MDLFAFRGEKGRYDITNFIEVPSYRVNQLPLYEDWVDGNKRTHRHHFRDKISGSFTVYFQTVSEFETFVQNVEDRRNKDMTYDVEVYCNNKRGTTEDPRRIARVYLSWEPIQDIPLYGAGSRSGYTINVEEP